MDSKVYYWADVTTIEVVKRLKGIRRFKGLDFVPKHCDEILFRMFSEQILKLKDDHAVLLWSHGGFHDLSFHFAPNVPYAKSVDDAHCDTYVNPGFVCSNNHNYYTLISDPNSIGLEVLGCHPNYMGMQGLGHTGPTVKATHEGEPEKPLIIREDFDSGICEGVAHKSIDLDVVEGFPCEPHYAQANEGVTIETVCSGLDALMNRADVVRLDVGGVASHTFKINKRFPWKHSSVSQKAIAGYAKTLDVWFSH